MTLHRMVDGVQVDLTPDEEATQLAEWAANDSATVATLYITNRVMAINALGHRATYEVIYGTTAYNNAVDAIIAKYPAPT